ncbi:unnamed protein product [Parnassius apollo]|uniref:(apollo) hypothetical protein n=1 Tax=Parnassius apollo TaxID=110799 RepID=A0A8S3YFZ2_PARAO|nr:unnamed protein product [Parnassius apollo]
MEIAETSVTANFTTSSETEDEEQSRPKRSRPAVPLPCASSRTHGALHLPSDGEVQNRATGIFPQNTQEVLKKIAEIQEEILSYGVDQALIDYLKKTRAPKPMELKRNKKDDQTGILIQSPNNDTKEDQDFEIQSINDNIHRLDKFSGIDIENSNFKNAALDPFNLNNTSEENYNKQNDWSKYQHSTLILKTPKSLSSYCIDIINTLLCNTVHKVT